MQLSDRIIISINIGYIFLLYVKNSISSRNSIFLINFKISKELLKIDIINDFINQKSILMLCNPNKTNKIPPQS